MAAFRQTDDLVDILLNEKAGFELKDEEFKKLCKEASQKKYLLKNNNFDVEEKL